MKILYLMVIFILTIPTTEARTRKPIPAGRFEALTGIKTSTGTNQTDVNQVFLDSLWSKFASQIKAQSKVFYSVSSNNLVFPSNLNVKLTNEKSEPESLDSAIISNLNTSDDWLIKMLKKESTIFIKSEKSFDQVYQAAKVLNLNLLYFSVDSNEFVFQKK